MEKKLENKNQKIKKAIVAASTALAFSLGLTEKAKASSEIEEALAGMNLYCSFHDNYKEKYSEYVKLKKQGAALADNTLVRCLDSLDKYIDNMNKEFLGMKAYYLKNVLKIGLTSDVENVKPKEINIKKLEEIKKIYQDYKDGLILKIGKENYEDNVLIIDHMLKNRNKYLK